MNNQDRVRIVTQCVVQEDQSQQFIQWQKMLHDTITKFPGYVSQAIMEPMLPGQPNWIIIQYFDAEETAKKWLQSNERQALLKKVLPFLLEIEDIYVIDTREHAQTVAMGTISTYVPHEYEQNFLDFQAEIASVQSKFPGFLGYKLEKPRLGVHATWIATLTFDSEKHLDAWLMCEERKRFVEKLKSFSQESTIAKSSRGFSFWFNPEKKQNTVWKQNMLVLLTLYPVVFLLSYIQNFFMHHGLSFWFALFISNAVSTAILGWITVPWLTKHFIWWLEPSDKNKRKNTILGVLVVIALYGLSLLCAWGLSYFTL